MIAAAHFIELSVVAFILHIIWERAHVHLYTGYDGLRGRLPITVFAAFGDVLYSLGAVLFVALLKNNIDWIPDASTSDYIALAIAALFIALYVEYKAHVLRRWSYASGMPLIPYLKVGFSPILQMVILLPLSVYIVAIISNFTF